jgi:hypothetical protein
VNSGLVLSLILKQGIARPCLLFYVVTAAEFVDTAIAGDSAVAMSSVVG